MTPTDTALLLAAGRLAAHVQEIGARLDAGDHRAWSEFYRAVTALAAVAPLLAPEARGALLTTRQLADRLQVAPKTILRRRARGQIEAVQLGKRGRGALRWTAGQA